MNAFEEGDCRSIDLKKTADLALCLYDVVGSFVREEDNRAIVKNIHRHLKRGAILVLSVMNRELTEHIAIHKVPVVAEHHPEFNASYVSSDVSRTGISICALMYWILPMPL